MGVAVEFGKPVAKAWCLEGTRLEQRHIGHIEILPGNGTWGLQSGFPVRAEDEFYGFPVPVILTDNRLRTGVAGLGKNLNNHLLALVAEGGNADDMFQGNEFGNAVKIKHG